MYKVHNIIKISCIITLLVISIPLSANGWSFHYQKTSCPYTPVPLQDIKDAVWAAKATYGDHGVNQVIQGNGYKITHIITKEYKLESVKLIVAEKSSTVMIAFMGTVGGRQLEQEMASVLKHPEGVQVNIAGENVRMVQYFWEVFLLLKNEIDEINLLRSPTKKYVITGHSLGGALASIFAIYAMVNKVNMWYNKNSRLITFGEPRVGDKIFAEIHDRLILPSRKLRVINQDDIVPHLPPFILEYRQHSRGLWMKNKSEWRVCRKDESLISCSNTHFLKFNTIDHDINRYIESINNFPEKVDVCLSIFFACKTYGDLNSALYDICNK